MINRGRLLRIAGIAVAAIVVLVVGAGVAGIILVNPNQFKPDIVAAVKRATGRDLALNGKISLRPSLWPTIEATDVTFSNPPGFSRPQMASLQGLELQLGLLRLLSGRIAIERLMLLHPDILLETDAAGHVNWQMTPEASPAASQAQAKPRGGVKAEVSVASIRIEDGTLAYRDDHTAKVATLALPAFEATAASPDAPLYLEGDAAYNGIGFSLTGNTGSINRLQDPDAATPWPVSLAVTVGRARLTADGSLTRPLQGKGYKLAINAKVPDTAALAPLLPAFVPTSLQDVAIAAKIADQGGPLPEVSALSVHVGAADLGAELPGLTLDHLDIAAAAADRPAKADATGKLRDQPVAFTATTGPLAVLLTGAPTMPFPIDATLQVAGATISANGAIADPGAMAGAHLALAANIPDLSAFSSVAGRPLPAIRQVAFHGTLTDSNGGLRHGVAIRAMSLTTADGDLAGDAELQREPKLALTATLQSQSINLDTVQAAIDATPAALPPAQPADTTRPPPPSADTARTPPRPRRDQSLFPDQPIPFDLLRLANADLALTIADLRTGGADYKAISAHATLNDGKLAIDPVAADVPGGHLTASLSADATKQAPPVHLVLHAPGVALKTILAATHEPSYATGDLEVFSDLSGAGESPHDIAASLDGYLGLAMAGGTIDNRLLGSLLGKVMNTLNALDLVGKGGESELKCFAMKLNARHGIATIQPLALRSSLLTMTGAGTINLGNETVSMTLAPQARIAGTGLVIPVNVSGPLRDPAVKVNEVNAAERNAGTVAGAIIGNATPLGIVGGLLGGDKLFGNKTDICPASLAAARGPAAAAAKPDNAVTAAKPDNSAQADAKPDKAAPAAANPAALLKNLFH
jgi:AsmA protein